MLVRLLGISLILAATAVAAEGEPCTPPQPGAWVEMSRTDGPRVGGVADVKTGFLGGSRWWLWDAFSPLTDSRVFDARCNTWRRTTVAKGTRLPRQIDRRYGVLFGDDELAVLGPTWDEAADGSSRAEALGVFVLDGERLEWTNVVPAIPLVGREARFFQGEGRVVFWDEQAGRGAIFTLATKRWEAFTERPPLLGRGYDCSWIQGGAWLIANPSGVFRFGLDAKTWSTVFKPEKPMEMQDLGGCLRSSSAGGLTVASPRSVYTPHRALFVIEGAGTSAWEIPWPEGEGVSVIPAGNTVWLREGYGQGRFRRYERGTKKWVPVAIPKGLDARFVFISEMRGQVVLMEPAEASRPVPQGRLAPPVEKSTPTRVSLWNGKSFGRPIALGIGEGFRDEAQAALGGLVAFDKAAIRVLDMSGKERLRLPSPPRWLAWSGLGPRAFVTWGEVETRVGHDCHNPFHPIERKPDMPVCAPSREVTYTRIHPGGFMLPRAQGDEAPEK